jgi:RNA polymerase sigma-70 factor (ECF subfamily)
VFAIARHRLFHRLRAQQRLHSFEGKLAAKPQTSQTSPSTIVRQQSAARQLVTMLRELPLELQLTLELFYWEKLSYEDVGYVLGIGREAVKSRLRRAKSLLQEKLADDAHPRAPTRPLQNWASAMRDALSTTRLERLHRRSEE